MLNATISARIVGSWRHCAQCGLRPRRAAFVGIFSEIGCLRPPTIDELDEFVGDLEHELPLTRPIERITRRLLSRLTVEEVVIGAPRQRLADICPGGVKAPGGKLERRDERAVAYPAVIIPGEANWLLRLRIQAWIGCKACGQQPRLRSFPARRPPRRFPAAC